MTGKIIENVWDCTYCGATKVRGRFRECPQCGHPRNNNVTFYIDNPQDYVMDEKLVERALQGPDWVCPACECLNAANADFCVGCGVGKDQSTKDYFQNQVDMHTKENKTYQREEAAWEAFKSVCSPTLPHEHANDASCKKRINWRKILTITLSSLLAVAMIAGIVLLLMPRDISGTVMSMSWERSIEIEEYKTVRESDWSVPVGGHEVSSSREIHHYDKVLDHYETKTRTRTEQVLDHYESYVSGYRDLGNGFSQEIISQRPVYRTETRIETYQEPVYKQVPVYQTKYVYDIDKWVHQSYKITSSSDTNPYWSDYKCKDNEREGTRSEVYTITVQDKDGNTKDYKLSFSQWNSLATGQSVKLKTDLFGNAELIFEEDT